uniref:Small ribosomal subunit protein eS6 n=1 Tax=Panthera leo TaxID=9689 RepID=A0A8C8WH52_PANLE
MKNVLISPGGRKLIEVDDEWKLSIFYEKRMATEAADALGEEWKGSVAQISGDDGRQGLPPEAGCSDTWPCPPTVE